MMSSRTVFEGSDATATKRLMAALESHGDAGRVAAMLFRAQKASTRAKRYRGGTVNAFGREQSYRDLAYSRKGWAIGELCRVLSASWPTGKWGWGLDPAQAQNPDVVYVDLPTGQVSFHCNGRLDGPDYPGQWDGRKGLSTDRILEFCEMVLGQQTLLPPF